MSAKTLRSTGGYVVTMSNGLRFEVDTAIALGLEPNDELDVMENEDDGSLTIRPHSRLNQTNIPAQLMAMLAQTPVKSSILGMAMLNETGILWATKNWRRDDTIRKSEVLRSMRSRLGNDMNYTMLARTNTTSDNEDEAIVMIPIWYKNEFIGAVVYTHDMTTGDCIDAMEMNRFVNDIISTVKHVNNWVRPISKEENIMVKTTGLVRRIDDLYRIVIPKEVRTRLHLREGDPMEVLVDDDNSTIVLRPYQPICGVNQTTDIMNVLWRDINGIKQPNAQGIALIGKTDAKTARGLCCKSILSKAMLPSNDGTEPLIPKLYDAMYNHMVECSKKNQPIMHTAVEHEGQMYHLFPVMSTDKTLMGVLVHQAPVNATDIEQHVAIACMLSAKIIAEFIGE